MKYKTTKNLTEIKGCADDLDPVSILNFISQNEFEIRPHWKFEEELTKAGGTARFKAILEMNLQFLCQADGQNKKDSKVACAKLALYMIAPVAFKQRYSDEKVDKTAILKAFAPENRLQEGPSTFDEKSILISDPRLHQLGHLFEPYTPYTYLK